jgi:uncharacterized protein (TIGR00730 family)
VFCGSSFGTDAAYRQAAEAVGRAIAGGGHTMVYGGGNVGLMGAAADAALRAGAPVIGVMTEQLVELEKAHHGLTELDIQPTMHARKARMVDLSDGVIVLPGGFGTMDETFEVLTWNQLGLIECGLVFLDVDGFFQSLFDFVDRAVGSGFVSPAHGAMAQRATDPFTAVELACQPPPGYSPKWLDALDRPRR